MAKSTDRSTVTAAWFVRAASVVVMVFWVLRIVRSGWSHAFDFLASPMGAAMLLLLSLTLEATGKPRKIFAIGTIILALGVLLLVIAGFVAPQ